MNDRIPPAHRTRRPYYNPAYLLKIYRWMAEYEAQHKFKPSTSELVDAKLASSTSVVRYYLDRMTALNLIHVPTLKYKGRTITPNRSIILLPLSHAHEAVQQVLQSEKEITEHEHTNQ